MGIYHDVLDKRREMEELYGIYVDVEFAILCVPDKPSDSYYGQVIANWESEVARRFFGEEEEG